MSPARTNSHRATVQKNRIDDGSTPGMDRRRFLAAGCAVLPASLAGCSTPFDIATTQSGTSDTTDTEAITPSPNSPDRTSGETAGSPLDAADEIALVVDNGRSSSLDVTLTVTTDDEQVFHHHTALEAAHAGDGDATVPAATARALRETGLDFVLIGSLCYEVPSAAGSERGSPYRSVRLQLVSCTQKLVFHTAPDCSKTVFLRVERPRVDPRCGPQVVRASRWTPLVGSWVCV